MDCERMYSSALAKRVAIQTAHRFANAVRRPRRRAAMSNREMPKMTLPQIANENIAEVTTMKLQDNPLSFNGNRTRICVSDFTRWDSAAHTRGHKGEEW